MSRRSKVGLAIAASCFLMATILLWPRLPGDASNALKSADHYELFSIDPLRNKGASGDLFHGYRILGTTIITDVAVRDRLNAALRGGVKSAFSNGCSCFNPRHGIRVTAAGQVTDFLICFECHHAYLFRGDECVVRWITDASPQPAFDQALQQAGVPLPPPEN